MPSQAARPPLPHVSAGSTMAAPLPPTSLPIAVPNSVLDTLQPRLYHSNVPPDSAPPAVAPSDAAAASRPHGSSGFDRLHSSNRYDRYHHSSAYDSASASPSDRRVCPPASQATALPLDAQTAPLPVARPLAATSFSAASLPRTSSLLPPPCRTVTTVTTVTTSAAGTAPFLRHPFYALPSPAAAPVQKRSSDRSPPATASAVPPRERRPSRSNSIGGGSESPRNPNHNLNRWSTSTASSRASVAAGYFFHRHQRSASFSRRLSVDSVVLSQTPSGHRGDLSDLGPSETTTGFGTRASPRKLQKTRPATASATNSAASSPSTRTRRCSPTRHIPPFTSLPPIISLPSLEQEVQNGSDSLSQSLANLLLPAESSDSHAISTAVANGHRALPRQRSPKDNTQAFYLGNAAHSDRRTTLDSPEPPKPQVAAAQSLSQSQLPSQSRRNDQVSTPVMAYGRESEAARGYTRSRSQAKGSIDSSRSRDRGNKPPSQKTMLSRALQKANAAVQLDNAGNSEGARYAYAEACDLLHQVLLKTQGEEDQRKLEAIRATYTTRIEELDQLGPMNDNRPLPKEPTRKNNTALYMDDDDDDDDMDDDMDDDDMDDDDDDEEDDDHIIETARVTRIYNDEGVALAERAATAYPQSTPPTFHQPGFASSASLLNDQYTLQSSFSRSPRSKFQGANLTVSSSASSLHPPPIGSPFMPAPLSPRRIPSNGTPYDDAPPPKMNVADSGRPGLGLDFSSRIANHSSLSNHARIPSHESVSWLDPIDESGGSAASSVHSRSSSRIRRKHIRGASGATEAEFGAALDDAIEAAYDDGYEPMSPEYIDHPSLEEDILTHNMRRVELAKNRARETEREASAFEKQMRMRQYQQQPQQTRSSFLDPADDSEDEERILEEMTSGYAIEDFAFNNEHAKPKSLPRESDSSNFTNHTWHSSLASNPSATASTGLSTVAENTVLSNRTKGLANAVPPPTQALPKLPPQSRPPSAQSTTRGDNLQSVRSRRLSGQNMKLLKIDTASVSPPVAPRPPVTTGHAPSMSITGFHPPRIPGYLVQQRQAMSAGPIRNGTGAATAALPFSRMATASPAPDEPAIAPPTPPLPPDMSAENSGSPSTNAKSGLRKNFSSSSLRSMRGRNMSVSNLDDGSDMSPATPSNPHFALGNHSQSRLPAIPALPTPFASAFKERTVTSSAAGGMFILESDFHSPTTPGSPNLTSSDAPAPLEPCPSDTLLRPFWLMRCLFQTLVHPRGGYLSNKLFVPSDVWRVKGVKLRNVDEKISNCDLLTAALLKLARVNTFDADAMLEEMQSLEGVLEQAQTSLARRLGNEVGVQSTFSLFKDSTVTGEVGDGSGVGTNGGAAGNGASAAVPPRNGSVSGNRSFSWRRLRSKNSAAGLNHSMTHAPVAARKDSISESSKDGAPLASLPMTTHPTSKPIKRDLLTARFVGPQAHYMASLAKLFDAAQSIDQIARQVEDPGLRHADKTQVGLELCTRHAAEFFAFYICRFVLSDVSLLMEKFIKRGSEWVLS